MEHYTPTSAEIDAAILRQIGPAKPTGRMRMLTDLCTEARLQQEWQSKSGRGWYDVPWEIVAVMPPKLV